MKWEFFTYGLKVLQDKRIELLEQHRRVTMYKSDDFTSTKKCKELFQENKKRDASEIYELIKELEGGIEMLSLIHYANNELNEEINL